MNKDNHWQFLFDPESVAVVGATSALASWGYGIMQRLLSTGKRNIYPVNTVISEVMGMATYPSVIDIPAPVDLAVIVVPAANVAGVLSECVAKRVKAAVIITAGFAETGDSGRQMENELIKIATEGGIRFIGPNSMGHADAWSQLSTLAFTDKVPTGALSLVSQSGFYGQQIIYKGMEFGLGFSKLISSGNEASLHFEDYLEYLARDENTRVIAAYIEGLREGQRFFKLAKEITARKPVLVIKAGRTQESARAALSHTGALAGSEAVYAAAFRQAGVIRVDDDDELCDVATALLNQPLPRGNRIGILTVGGGPGVMAAEACESEGLVIAPLSPQTMDKLDGCLTARWSRGNPVDTAGMTAAQRGFVFSALRAIMEDENIDAVLFQIPVLLDIERITSMLKFSDDDARTFQTALKEYFRQIKVWAHEFNKPVILVTLIKDETALPFLHSEGITAYQSPRRAAAVLKHLVWYHQHLNDDNIL